MMSEFTPYPRSRDAFTVEVADRGDVVIVETTGELDLAADPLLGATLAQAEALGRPVVADLTAVSFCASCILGQLAAAATRLSAAGQELVVATEAYVVRRPLSLLGMDRYFTVVPDVPAALAHLGRSAAAPATPEPSRLEPDPN
ncbi:STAS domain-containing protein [Amycolatopsis sp. PS_44_ISF1]|uniref:STAS domain-containing protein n=1 Tax=Amycolatopsis sp. PS_44_ISF1 TaxID=2974917 RepID=UPI0028DDF09D|nr:STAS domain-containing protein [Amycolatopsis sp. PS_44_ISF1]MDT8914493.1 STAS domain-containing protein [Amycolatopsis sp. PS_44_ISF1]